MTTRSALNTGQVQLTYLVPVSSLHLGTTKTLLAYIVSS